MNVNHMAAISTLYSMTIENMNATDIDAPNMKVAVGILSNHG
ncbi:MAG: hypothetical protein ACJAYN_002117 [Bermanella sp.]|jgi:hypothetical protein